MAWKTGSKVTQTQFQAVIENHPEKKFKMWTKVLKITCKSLFLVKQQGKICNFTENEILCR